MPLPDGLPAMPGQAIRFAAVGPGVERLEEEVGGTVSRTRACWCCPAIWWNRSSACAKELDDIAEGHFDIVIGTQLVAKGHHFPKLNLVGIVDADLGLANGDPRAAERTFQLLHQVVGPRRPRGGPRPRISADAPAGASGDARADFAATARRSTTPRSRCARTTAIRRSGGSRASIVSGGDKHEAESFARKLAAAAPLDEEVRVLGPAEAPLAVVRGRYRFRLLVKSPRAFDLSAYLRGWLADAPKTQGQRSSWKSMSIRRASCDAVKLPAILPDKITGGTPCGCSRRSRSQPCSRSALSRRRRRPIPSKPIKIIVSTSAGGMTDILARFLGQHITAKTGQTV